MKNFVGYLLAAILIPCQLWLLYQTVIAPRITQGDWQIPAATDLHQIKGGLARFHGDYVLRLKDGGDLVLHCEPDPPLLHDCIDPFLPILRKAHEVEITFKSELYQRARPGVLLVSLAADDQILISAADSAKRINNTYVGCSRGGSCARDNRQFGLGDTILIGFLLAIPIPVIVVWAMTRWRRRRLRRETTSENLP